MTDTPTIGHNSASAGEMLAENPSLIFLEEGMDKQLFDEIRAEIAAHEPDLKTVQGRKDIASLAYSIATRKTSIDGAGKVLNEDHRKAINAVDAVRKRVRDTLDTLRDEARKPLTDWEESEEKRKSEVTRIRTGLSERPAFGASSSEIQAMIYRVKSLNIDSLVFQDLTQATFDEQSDAIEQLEAAHRAAEEAEQQREALAQMQREKEKAEARQRQEAAKAEIEAK